MNSREKAIIGVSVPAALLCAVMGAKPASIPIERLIVASQTREAAERVAKKAADAYPPASSEPCEPGPVLGDEDGLLPIWNATMIPFKCGDVPVRCIKNPESFDDFLCILPYAPRYSRGSGFYGMRKKYDRWKSLNAHFDNWKKTGEW